VIVEDLGDSPPDGVDVLLDSWARRRPDLADDFRSVSVITRLLRLRGHVENGLHACFKEFGLGAPDFTALVTLARVGDSGGVPQQRLADELGLTSGTVSVRIDQLVDRGLAERRPDPTSRRSTLVSLTPAGADLFDRIISAHLANEQRMLAALSPAERQLLTGLLRTLLVEYEGSASAPGGERLGLTLAPTHVTIAMREAVGLPRVDGMLVRSIAPNSPAARADIKSGDVLLTAGGHALRSIAVLYAAIRETGTTPLRLTLLRGTDRRETTLPLPPAPSGRGPASNTRGRPAEHTV
jgi:DNA-binding MarR family transcriptional regulator